MKTFVPDSPVNFALTFACRPEVLPIDVNAAKGFKSWQMEKRVNKPRNMTGS